MVFLSEGAEARLEKHRNIVTKTRVTKSYRVDALDSSLRRSRTRREAKILKKLQGIIPVPSLYSSDDYSLSMEYISGEPLKTVLTKESYLPYCKKLGELVAKLHDQDIIHGDLTTSNMLVQDKRCVIIDFGLSFVSQKVEDKAVDLHLLRRALESKHPLFWEDAFAVVLDAYVSHSSQGKTVSRRLLHVEERGRHKHKQ